MRIARGKETGRGPSDWFTGDVSVEPITGPDGSWRIGAASVHFAPGARTAWHTHPLGQTIWVTDGVGLCQGEGGSIEVIRPGDSVFFEPGENHWHGASADRSMIHTAIQQADEDGAVVAWGRQVSDEEYAAAPASG